jgi:hypothetical protein
MRLIQPIVICFFRVSPSVCSVPSVVNVLICPARNVSPLPRGICNVPAHSREYRCRGGSGRLLKNFRKTNEKNLARIGTIKVANENRGENLVDEWTVGDR